MDSLLLRSLLYHSHLTIQDCLALGLHERRCAPRTRASDAAVAAFASFTAFFAASLVDFVSTRVAILQADETLSWCGQLAM